MKKVLILLLVSSIFLSGCEFIRTKILGKPSKAEIEAMEQARMDSIRHDSIEQAQAARIQDSIAEAKADSIAQADSQAEAKRKEEAERAKNKYHVISGSFKTPKYAERYKERMINKYGYDKTLIVQANNDFKLVSINQHPSYSAALNQAKSLDEMQAWVYVAN